MRIEVMDIPFDNVNMDEAIDAAVRILERGKTAYVVTPNAEIVYETLFDAELRQILCQADLILPDGAGVVLGAKILGTPLKEKVAGIEFGTNLMQRLEHTDTSFFFLGGKPGIADLAAQRLLEKFPDLTVCGTADGYFQDEAAVVEMLNQKKPDVLFVCLGAPKQEKFMRAHRDELNVKLMIGLGGSLDGYAGTVKRAPKWMIRCNLEWFYRLIKEPWRLGRMMRLPKFMLRVFGRRLKG